MYYNNTRRSEMFGHREGDRKSFHSFFSENGPVVQLENPHSYGGDYAVQDTAGEVRKVRGMGISVLGVFAGKEADLAAEKKIFGKDFAYIRDIANFSNVVGEYLKRQLDADD